MSYEALPNQPPAYGDNPEGSRTAGDHIPDDFKYSVDVASCELPIRQMFIRKVYALLTAQILLSVVVGFIIRSNEGVKLWCFDNMWLFFVSIFGSIGFMLGASFKAKSYPTNLMLLTGFTLCESYGLGMVCSLVKSDVLIQAILLTLVIFIGLTLFAFQSKYDFTQWQGMVSLGVWVLIGWGILFMFFPQTKFLNLIYSGLGAVLFSIYILIDTQHIMKTYHLDDEIPATISLYLDIINLFLFILRILNNNNNNN